MLHAHPGKPVLLQQGDEALLTKPPHPIRTQVSRPNSLEHMAMGGKVLSLGYSPLPV